MEEYIEKNQLKEKLRSLFKYESFPISDIEQIIDWLPVIPKHGKWVFTPTTGRYRCSACEKVEKTIPWGKPPFDYCPNCGAKMDGEENEN